MSDPHRPDSARAVDSLSAGDVAGRDAKIEELLLSGLDHYFAAQYEQAINVWTRALFLDRNHARARAYIERARSALAERQRVSEELLHDGLAAFRRGQADEARRLLRAALDGGAPIDEAGPILDRLSHLDAGQSARTHKAPLPDRRPPATAAVGTGRRRSLPRPFAWIVGAAAIVAGGLCATVMWQADEWRSWFALPSAGPSAAVPPVAPEVVLPPPTRGERALARARALAGSGYLHDALSALESVRSTDPQKTDADRLRAEIQRQLLLLGRSP
jgi:tetratricopeptide (TPR) repeat protein